MLDGLDAALTGRGPADPEAEPLKAAIAERGLPPKHALDLLDAFRMDATKLRYADWHELMHYCSLSAMPVGRCVLDVHGEDPTDDLAGFGFDLRRAAGDQSLAGLRERLQKSRPRLPSARHAREAWLARRGSFGGARQRRA